MTARMKAAGTRRAGQRPRAVLLRGAGLGAAAMAATLAIGTAAASADRALYVADGGTTGVGSISQYSLAVPGGALAPLSPARVATGGAPQHVAITSDGRFAYATAAEPGLLFAYRVSESGALIPLATPSVAAGVGAHGVSVTPDGRFLYVGAQEPGAVFQYSIGEDGVPSPLPTASVPSGEGASGVAITPDGRSVYVTNLRGGSVSQYDVDPATGALTPKSPATVPLRAPSGLAVSPDGRSLFVATLAGRIGQFDIDRRTGALTPKRPGHVRVGRSVGGAGVAITPDGRYLYTPNSLAGTISQFAIRPGTGRLSPLRPATVRSDGQPEGLAMSPDGRSLYASAAKEGAVRWFTVRRDGRLAGRGRAAIPAGPGTHGVAATPDQGPVARFSVRGATRVKVGQRVRFDARASSDADGAVRGYRWRFGDGHRHRANRAVVTHRFERPGRYTVRLVVTDDEGCSNRMIYTGQSALCNGGPQAVATQRITVRR